MTTSTSSSNSMPSHRTTLVCSAILLLAGIMTLALAAIYARRPATLLETLQANFDRAARGERAASSRMIEMPRNPSAGLVCYPAQLDGSASRFEVILPQHIADRFGTLAVIAPNGKLRYVYISYGIDTDPEDLIIPSSSIDWERARVRHIFDVDAKLFDALVPDASAPELLFRETGVYQFALLNTNDRSLLEFNRPPFRVKAGCVVHWQP
ncbi:MAG: hypothetical protein AB7F98_18095 [Novosphingobium sp.]